MWGKNWWVHFKKLKLYYLNFFKPVNINNLRLSIIY
jgi:hypothetical protein